VVEEEPSPVGTNPYGIGAAFLEVPDWKVDESPLPPMSTVTYSPEDTASAQVPDPKFRFLPNKDLPGAYTVILLGVDGTSDTGLGVVNPIGNVKKKWVIQGLSGGEFATRNEAALELFKALMHK
jgi:hypothetical protein